MSNKLFFDLCDEKNLIYELKPLKSLKANLTNYF